jgi:MFS family permease
LAAIGETRPAGWPAGAVLSGIALGYISSFGQNFFIAIFGGEIRQSFGLSNGQFGLLYTGVTLASAVALVWAGRFADRLPVSRATALTLGFLGGAALLLATTDEIVLLALALFMLRLFGQGMSMQLSATAVARWFGKGSRGKALGVAGIGNPIGEATLPLLAVMAMAAFGWRNVWLAAAALLLLVVLPGLFWLVRRVERASPVAAEGGTTGDDGRASWSVSQVLRHPAFYLLLPGLLAPITVNVAVFFHQVALTEAKGWDPAWFVASYPVSAGATVAATLGAGWMIDRFGATRMLPFVLVPMLAAVLLLASGSAPWVIPAYLALAGIAMGTVMPLQAAVLAEVFGTGHFGAIRAVLVACNVFLGAIGPGIAGVLNDVGVSFDTQLYCIAGYVVACGLLLVGAQGAVARVLLLRGGAASDRNWSQMRG